MSFLQDDLMNAELDRIWGNTDAVFPSIWYIALLVALPDSSGTGGTEATYGGYARAAVANDLTQWPAAAAGVKQNANPVSYGTATSGPQNVVGFAFVDDPTDPIDPTNLYAVVDLAGAPITITNGAPVAFPAGAIDLTRCV